MALTFTTASAYLSVSCWRLSTQPPSDKVIVIGAPYTSNWDGVFTATSMWEFGRMFSFLAEDSVVKAPVLGRFAKKIGVVAVERSASRGLVEQVVQRIRETDTFTLCITPGGMRSPRAFWKSGLYRIAMEIGVPIQLGFIDRNTRMFGWGPTYQLTGDVHADMGVIRALYANEVGIHPKKTSVPRSRAEDEAE